MQKQEINKTLLRDVITDAFNEEELGILCSDVQQRLSDNKIELSVNLDVVSGNGKESQVLNLINYLDRRGHLGYLIEAVKEARPGVNLRDEPTEPEQPIRYTDIPQTGHTLFGCDKEIEDITSALKQHR